MKKLLTLLAFVCIAKTNQLNAQVFNSGFEHLNSDGTLRNWGNVFMFPVSLDTAGNQVYDSVVFDGQLYAPTTDSYDGFRAIELHNAYDYTTGIGIAGSVSASEDSIFSGWSSFVLVPITNQPFNFGFYYKYFPVYNDTAVARLTLWDSTGNQLGEAKVLITDSASTYTAANAYVEVMAPGTPAFYNLNISTFYSATPGSHQPTLGTRLLVDDVNFNVVSISGIKQTTVADAAVITYPNPASNRVTIECKQGELLSIRLMNALGEVVYQEFDKSVRSQNIDLHNLSAGIYFAQVLTTKGISTQRIVKQ